jgi:hypothetical protein
VQPAHQFGRLDVHRVLVLERAPLDTEDEPEPFDVPREVGKRERDALVLVEVVELEVLEVAHQEIAWQVSIPDAGEVIEGLLFRLDEVTADALLLHQQHAPPEQIDEPAVGAEISDGLLEGRHAADGHPEDFEEVAIKELGLPLLVAVPGPILGELGRSRPNLVPGEPHGISGRRVRERDRQHATRTGIVDGKLRLARAPQ